MSQMKDGIVGTAAAVAMAAALVFAAAQPGTAQEPKGKAAGEQKGEKKAGSHSMTGCLQKGTDANTWKLTDVTDKGPKSVEILEVASGVNLTPHVGHKVTITGTTISTAAAAKKEKEPAKKEAGEHHMAVSAVKMVSATCP